MEETNLNCYSETVKFYIRFWNDISQLILWICLQKARRYDFRPAIPAKASDQKWRTQFDLVICLLTSSTAQGGGGSFKNRKPIGEIGCCESGMAERTHWWTERCLRSPLFLSLSLTIYLLTYVSMYLSIYRSIDLSIYLSICLSVCLSVCLSLSFI